MANVNTIKVAKYARLVEELRDKISSRELQPGDRLPSFAEFRSQSGATIGTVERVLRVLEKDGLIVREHGRGTFVAQPVVKKAHAIGVLNTLFAPHARSDYWVQLVNGVQEVAARHGMHTTLLEGSLPEIQWSHIDGVLILNADLQSFEASLRRLPPEMRAVSVLTVSDQISSVVADDFGGVRDLTRHLLSLGHRRIGYLLQSSLPILEQRLAGYSMALRQAGLDMDERLVRFNEETPTQSFLDSKHWDMQRWPSSARYSIARGRWLMEEWLDNGWRDLGCTAILAQNDAIAIGAIEALREADYDVPGQVSVVGFDGTEVSAYGSPRLTTVKVPLREIGIKSAETLMRRMSEDEGGRETIVLPTHVILGDEALLDRWYKVAGRRVSFRWRTANRRPDRGQDQV